MNQIKIEFNEQQLTLVVNCLAEQPFKLVAEVMNHINQQVQAHAMQQQQRPPLQEVPKQVP